MSNKKPPMFDADGRLLPLRISALMGIPGEKLSVQKSEERKSLSKIPLERFILSPSYINQFAEPPSKRQRTEKSIKKQLFKEPPAKSKFNKRWSSSRLLRKPPTIRVSNIKDGKEVIQKKCEQSLVSTPLIPMDDAEGCLLNKKLFHPKPVKTVLFPMGTVNEIEDINIEICNLNVAPDMKLRKLSSESENSDIEFLKNEEAILSSLGRFEELRELLDRDQEQFKQLKHHIENYDRQHNSMQSRVRQILDEITQNNFGNKENMKRVSSGLKVKMPSNNFDFNLRKSALRNCAMANFGDQFHSPKTKNAINMYNNLRKDYNLLCTPKMTPSLPVKKNCNSLSRKVQQQCLMLQDTPRH